MVHSLDIIHLAEDKLHRITDIQCGDTNMNLFWERGQVMPFLFNVTQFFRHFLNCHLV